MMLIFFHAHMHVLLNAKHIHAQADLHLVTLAKLTESWKLANKRNFSDTEVEVILTQ